jgi:hypothetical protein
MSKKVSIFLSIAITVFLVSSGWYSLTSSVHGATVSVTAAVAESVSCGNSASATAFGTLTSGAISTAATPATTTLSCNSAAGCTLSVADQGDGVSAGLYNATSTGNVILSTSATLSAGTEGYGIQAATSTAGSSAVLTLSSIYKQTGNAVGGLSRTAVQLASTTSPTASREVVVNHKAAISAVTKAGNYTDTITYSCLGN